MATDYTADLIESLRNRQLELADEQLKVAGALFALTGKQPVGRPRKSESRVRPEPFTLRATPTR
jgi:hypothetical protein